MTPNLEDLLAQRPRRRGSRMPPDIREARIREQQYRNSHAQGKARTALARLHPDDYQPLYEQALALINAERGPLPGDEVTK